ncbi:TonB-dependent receptor plug domain-containing protein [Telluribacter sp.]|uniref:TonB-dependent receptor plug domain-containing protein n=1 Tax=Telluribacter sp. TaxID=1978767 RepID=UPI002E1551D0
MLILFIDHRRVARCCRGVDLFSVFKVRLVRVSTLLLVALPLLTALPGYAQRSDAQPGKALTDSIALEAVTVRGFVPERFMAGLKVQRIDSAVLQLFRFQSLTELLAFHTPLAFKSYGPGQLTSVSFRGTSPNHTAVLWNGVNINQPNLGQTDFSTIPVAGFDQLSVQYGAAASVVGTDAVGGSILLGSTPQPEPGLSLLVGREQASFGNQQTQLGARYGTRLNSAWVLSGKTLLYDGQMNNDYRVKERRGSALEPSTTAQRGLVQDLFFQNTKGQRLSAQLWLTDNQFTLTPQNLTSRELTRTQAYRTLLQYETGPWTLRTAWIRDIIDFGRGDFMELDHTETDRYLYRLEREFRWKLRPPQASLTLRVGGEWSHYRSRVEGYVLPLLTENRGDAFALLRWQASRRWLVSANVRQAFVTRFDPPLTPSVGAEYLVVAEEGHSLRLKGSVGRSYRVPTLNERYWRQLGNPDIRPESGLNKEIGLEEKYSLNRNHHITASLTAYHNRVDDWTYWNPDRNYRVENLQLVVARGLEAQTRWQGQWGHWLAGSNLLYAFTRTSQERIYDAYAVDVIGKQLVYVPVHSGTFSSYLQRGRSRLTGQLQAGSERYYTFDNSKSLPGYVLANVLAETTLLKGPWQGRLQGQVHNVLNTFYLNVKRNAMPGRYYSINFLLTYTNAK